MLLEVNNLAVSFGGVQALNLTRFSLEDKELRVVIGPNGAGKSTFMDILCGKTKPDTGEVNFNGKPINGLTEVEIAELGIGRKFQKPTVFPGLTVFENMTLAARMKKDVFSSLFFKMSPAFKARIHEMAERVGLENVLEQQAGALSHGQKQWLEIAIVVLQDPKLLLIDEPAAGMSDRETERTGELLLELSKEHGVIVIEHDMHFVRQIANRSVSVLVNGKLLMEGSFEEVRNDQRVIDCYLGRANAQLEKL
jgi:urea transport system ATP-binding protein